MKQEYKDQDLAALQQQIVRLEGLFELAPDAIVPVDDKADIVLVNDRGRKDVWL